VAIDEGIHRLDGLVGNIFHFWKDILEKVNLGVIFLQIFIKFFVGYLNEIKNLIASFELAVTFRFFLDGVVGQVDHLILNILQTERERARPDVAFIVPIKLLNPIL
jgi:hypothetical protein